MAQKDWDKNEFIDADDESYFSRKDQQFSHQALVMEAMRKCGEAAAHEMRGGWFNEKTDQIGNTVKTYIEDTRLKFIESVKGLTMVMHCDFDKIAKDIIPKLEKSLEEKKKELLKEQWEWYSSLNEGKKEICDKTYGYIHPGVFHFSLGWFQFYVEEQLKTYRLIFKELSDLTKRLGFYESKTIQE